MSSLQTLVQSIVTDLINARFEADVRVAELSQHYRDQPELRALSVPSLNIKNVSVELRFAFDDQEVAAADAPSDDQKKAIDEGIAGLRTNLLGLDAVTRRLSTPQARSAFSRTLNARLAKVATENFAAAPEKRRKAIETEADRILSSSNIRLTAPQRDRMLAGIQDLDRKVEAAPKPSPRSVPGVVVGGEALEKVGADRVSTIRFDIELDPARWADIDDGEGGVRSGLVED